MGLFEDKVLEALRSQTGVPADQAAIKAYDAAISFIVDGKWALGYMDRGMGHGSWGVIIEETGDLLLPDLPKEVALHLITIHNAVLERKSAEVQATQDAQPGRGTDGTLQDPDNS